MQMPRYMPAKQFRSYPQTSRLAGREQTVGEGITLAGPAECHAACAAGLAAARAACPLLGPFAPPCFAAAEAAFLYCNTRC